jgi:hypothetical protein
MGVTTVTAVSHRGIKIIAVMTLGLMKQTGFATSMKKPCTSAETRSFTMNSWMVGMSIPTGYVISGRGWRVSDELVKKTILQTRLQTHARAYGIFL